MGGGGDRWPSLSWLRSHSLPICAPLADRELSSQVIGHCDYLHMPGWGAARAVKALDRMKIFKTKPKSQGEVAMSFEDNISLEKVITSMKKVHEVPGDGAELIATALAVYLRQVVFNPVTKTEMPLADVGKEGLDASPLPDACGVIATGRCRCRPLTATRR